jgi:hypothetical protein
MISFDFMIYVIKGVSLDNQTLPNDLKIKISQTCIRIRPQNMLERSEGLAD